MATEAIVTEAARAAHRARMRRVAWCTLGASIVVGVGAPLVSTFLGLISAVALVGLLVGGSILVRASRDEGRAGSLEVTVREGRLTARCGDAAPHLVDQPVLAGQAFADHVQLTVGEPPGGLSQVELPLDGAARAAFVTALRAEHGVTLPERRAFARNLALILTVGSALTILGFVAYRLVVLSAAGLLVHGLQQLDWRLSLGILLSLALLGAALPIWRLTHRDPGSPLR